MKQRITAMLLSLALVLSVSAVSFASGEDPAESVEGTETVESMESELVTDAAGEAAEGTEEETIVVDAESTETPEEESGEAVEDAGEGEVPSETEEAETPVFDYTVEESKEDGPLIIFEELEWRIKKNNLSYKAIMSNLSNVGDMRDAIDKMDETLGELNDLKDLLERNPDLEGTEAVGGQTLESVDDARSELLAAAADLEKAGDPDVMQKQLKNGINQLVVGAQSLYIALVGMQQQETALERQLAALDRTLEEMRLRHQMGQISQLQLLEAESGRSSMASGLATLRMNVKTYKMQLEQMLGMEITGTVRLDPLPAVTDEQLAALNVEEDLKSVRKHNYDIYAAANAEDSGGGAAARYAYQETRQQVEMKFRITHAKLLDARQAVDASALALTCEEQQYAAAQLKYQQGTISRNALLTAEDELKTARESLQTAKNNLFAAYNNYCAAVERGILN